MVGRVAEIVEEHRYRDMSSAAKSVLMHIPSEQRNLNDVAQAVRTSEMKLECLRPLTEGIHKTHNTDGDDGGHGATRGKSSIGDEDRADDKLAWGCAYTQRQG